MCLNNARVITLKKDKVVYKVFTKKPDGTLITLYQKRYYELSDEPIHDELSMFDFFARERDSSTEIMDINGHDFEVIRRENGECDVYGGVFHSFENYDDAVNIANSNISGLHYWYGIGAKNVVVKCIIPKNAQLTMEGIFPYTLDFEKFTAKSYASSDIILKEIVYEI